MIFVVCILQVQTSLTEIDLLDQIDIQAENLSGGQKRRLSLAIALVGDPKVVFLLKKLHAYFVYWHFIVDVPFFALTVCALYTRLFFWMSRRQVWIPQLGGVSGIC